MLFRCSLSGLGFVWLFFGVLGVLGLVLFVFFVFVGFILLGVGFCIIGWLGLGVDVLGVFWGW